MNKFSMRECDGPTLYAFAGDGNHEAMIEIARRSWDISAHNGAPNAGAVLWYRNSAALGNKDALAITRELARDYPAVALPVLDRPFSLPRSRRVFEPLKLAA